MKRRAAFEITRFGENAPRISCQKLPRPAADAWIADGAAFVPIVAAAGLMGFTRAPLFLARQNDFHAAVLGAAVGGGICSEGAPIALSVEKETAVPGSLGGFFFSP